NYKPKHDAHSFHVLDLQAVRPLFVRLKLFLLCIPLTGTGTVNARRFFERISIGITTKGHHRWRLARKKELVSGEYLFWQADCLAHGRQARSAPQQSRMLTVNTKQDPANADGLHPSKEL